jgi:hypothetical protein
MYILQDCICTYNMEVSNNTSYFELLHWQISVIFSQCAFFILPSTEYISEVLL